MKNIDLSEYIQLEGQLFEDVQRSEVFEDSKTFVDCTPKSDPEEIMERYRDRKDDSDFDLKGFVQSYFHMPESFSDMVIQTGGSMEEHIDKLWEYLSRSSDSDAGPHSTLIPLSHPYIVPGGRFREIYYWDSYFTAEGLAVSGHLDTVGNLVKNFTHLIRQTGHVPNGNRRYYISRSQPPFLFLMVDLLRRHRGEQAIEPYLEALRAEYDFWMDGSERTIDTGPGYRRVVKLKSGSVMNRYSDDRPRPREESWREDVEVAEGSYDPRQVYRDLRAGAESGWDFTSRWLEDYNDLKSIQTINIIPVDLNALLWGMETKLAEWLDGEKSTRYKSAAEDRKKKFNELFWDDEEGYYFDYNFKKESRTDCRSLVGVYPLFLKLASGEQAARVAKVLEERFLKDGGLVTSLHETGQQWDAPNGWAPLQWMGVVGLRNYGHDELAETIARRWIELNRDVYDRTGKMMEKYNVCDLSLEGGGGEYPLQDGFGWTNGVVTALQDIYG